MIRSKAKQRSAYGVLVIAAFGLAGCTAPTAKPVAAPCQVGDGGADAGGIAQQGCGVESHQSSAPSLPPEDLLLDVGIRAFDASDADVEAAELRRAEGAYLAVGLRTELQATDAWGAVRVVSRPSEAIDLAVVARVEQSDGETLALRVRATDARGTRWLDERYQGKADAAAHARGAEPFAGVYAAVAADLAAKLLAMPYDELRSIRTVAELRFADRLAPGAFAGYLEESDGALVTRRLPAVEDPLFGQTRQVLGRERLFIDTVDEYFTSFEHRVAPALSDWRRSSVDSAVTQRDLLTAAQARELLGAIHVLGGIVGEDASGDWVDGGKALASLLDGVGLLAVAARNRQAAAATAEAARTETTAAGAEMLPATLALENSAATLERRVAKQYARATEALQRLHSENTGESPPANPQRHPTHFASIADDGPPADHGAPSTLSPPDAALERERELPPVSAGVDEELVAAVRLIEASRLTAAFDVLDGLVEAAGSAAYNGRELAHIHSVLAFAHYRGGDIAQASAALEVVVAHGADISTTRLAAANFSLARLRFELDEDALGLQAMRRGLSATDVQHAACATLCSPEARKRIAAVVEPGDGSDGCVARRSEMRWPRRLGWQFRRDLDVIRGQIDSGQPEAALATIDSLLQEHSKGAERALLWRYKASAYSALGDMAQAIQAYEKMLEGPGFIPPGAEGRTVYDLAHLHLAQGNHQRSLCYQRQWLHRSKFAERICPAACPSERRSRLAARRRR